MKKYIYIEKFCPKNKNFIDFLNEHGQLGLRYISYEMCYSQHWNGLDEENEIRCTGLKVIFEQTIKENKKNKKNNEQNI